MLIKKRILGEKKKLVMGQREKNTYSYLKWVKRFFKLSLEEFEL
jgi:hypothetical protein